jgi:hypothetical protein
MAGTVLAAALSFVLLTFGAAIGLSATSPWPNSGMSVKVIATLAVFWALAQQIGSLMAGGYVAGRMRSRWHKAGDEREFRDGLHGGLVWAVAVLISAFLVFATANLVVRTGADVAGKAVGGATSSTNNLVDTVLDAMLRPGSSAQATNREPSGVELLSRDMQPRRAQMESVANYPASSRARSRAVLYLRENRTYLANLVAQWTGISQQEAEMRVDDAIESFARANQLAGNSSRQSLRYLPQKTPNSSIC